MSFKEGRISRQDMIIEITKLVAKRSTCLRAEVGAVIVRENRIISTGYCGAPPGLPHCNDKSCKPGSDIGCKNTIHAEMNAIAFASRYGLSLVDTTLYCSYAPCLECSKLIISAGISEVLFIKPYRDDSGLMLLSQAGKIFSQVEVNMR